MRAKELFGTTVLDKNVKEVGRIDDVEIDTETGAISSIIVSLQKGLLSNDVIEIDFDKIATFGDYILLNAEIPKEDEEKAEEVTIEVEDADEDEE